MALRPLGRALVAWAALLTVLVGVLPSAAAPAGAFGSIDLPVDCGDGSREDDSGTPSADGVEDEETEEEDGRGLHMSHDGAWRCRIDDAARPLPLPLPHRQRRIARGWALGRGPPPAG